MSTGSIPRGPRNRAFLGNQALVSPGTAAAPAQAAAQALGPLARQAFAQRGEDIKTEQRRLRLDAQTEVATAANLIAAEFEGDENPDVEAYQAEFDATVGPIVNRIKDVGVHGVIDTFARGISVQKIGEMQIRNVRFDQQQRAVSVVSNTTALEAHFGLCDTDECRISTRQQIEANIAFAVDQGDLTPKAGGVLLRASTIKQSGAYVRGLINRSPAAALLVLGDPNDPFAKDIDPVERERLIASADVALTKQQTDLDQAEKLRLQGVASDFIERIFTPDHQDGLPTLSEIFDSDLGPSTQEHFAKLIAATAEGVDIDATDEALTNELWRRVHDPLHPQPITQAFQLLPFLGNGLSREDRDKLAVDIEALKKDPLEKSRNTIWKDLMKLADAQISSGTLVRKDPVGEGKFFDFRVLAEEQRRKLRQDGKSPEEIVQIVKGLIPPFVRSEIERARDLSARILGERETLGATPGRQEGESPLQALKRIGLD